jgi:hypothetical protein
MKYSDYNKDKRNEIEMDEFNIKSHLNTSLDLSGINVSEDLINRTLAAIKEHSAENKEPQTGFEENSKKVIPWNRYVRGFAGVAAAVLIVAVGYNVMKQVPLGSQKNSTKSTQFEEKAAYDSASEDSADGNNMFSAAEDSATASESADANSTAIDDLEAPEAETSIQYTITATDTTLSKEDGAGTTGSEGETGIADTQAMDVDQEEESPKISASMRNSEEISPLSFREIFLPNPVNAEYITIKDEANNTSISLTDQASILDFYSVMDQHQFTYANGDTSNQSYTVEVKSPEPQALYTLIVGQTIIVRYTEGDLVSENIFMVADENLFKQNLDEFYKKYSE